MNHPIDTYVGLRLRARRDALLLSEEELAEILHVPVVYIWEIEAGRKRVSVNLLMTLCDKLSVDPIYFFKEDVPGRLPKSFCSNYVEMSPILISRLLDVFETIDNDRERESLISLALRMVGNKLN